MIYIHGKPEWVGMEGKWVQADATGTIEIFVPTDQLDGHAVLIDKVRPKSGTEKPVYMDWEHLCDKPAAKLRNYQTTNQLQQAKTQSGKQVIPHTMESKLVSQIADGIKTGFDVYNDITANTSIATAKMPTPEEHALLMRKNVQFSSSCGEGLKDLGNKILDGLTWAWGEIKKMGRLAYFVLPLATVSRTD